MKCPPCWESMVYIDSLQKKYDTAAVQFFAVNGADHSAKALLKFPEFIKEHHLDYQILLVNADAELAYDVHILPTFFVIDQEGKVCYCIAGFYPYAFREMDKVIKKLLNN